MRTAILVLFFTLGAAPSPAAAADDPDSKAEAPKAVRLAPAVGDERAAPASDPPIKIDPIVFRRGYRLSIGPWTIQFSLPPGIDLLDLGDRVRGLMGVMLIVGVAIYLSDDREAISRRVVFWGLTLQWLAAVLVLRVPAGAWLVREAGSMIEEVVGVGGVDPEGPASRLFPILVLPTVVCASALSATLYRVGILQRVVRGFAAVAGRVFGTSGAESLDVAATMFLGQTEAPVWIRPYVPRLTNSELATVATVGMANVSGVVLGAYLAFGLQPSLLLTAAFITAPGAVLISKLLVPEDRKPATIDRDQPAPPTLDSGVFSATLRGTRDGFRMALYIAAAFLAVVGSIAFIDLVLGVFGASLEAFLGWALAPVAYMLGVAWEDCRPVGGVLGTRTAFNELVAFQDLVRLRGVILGRSFAIASFALCGFANLGSLGIQVAGLAALAPGRGRHLLRLGARALLAATLANFLTACVVGVLL